MKLAISYIGTPLIAGLPLIVRAGRDNRPAIPFIAPVILPSKPVGRRWQLIR